MIFSKIKCITIQKIYILKENKIKCSKNEKNNNSNHYNI